MYTMNIFFRVFHLYPLLVITLLLLSCKGDIGDECVTDTQCRAGQTCDLISDGGYCTIPDCRDDECPESSVCITFENDDKYCMAKCSTNDDCRDGYYCEQEVGNTSFCRQRD